ncbi:hypothetical protein ACFFR3_28920 [Nonomuraea salmonea]|uniref:Uncharacterized protein n=1 Tax=Nonomuraea salmonea TaxID=46181 RepID=A0ABV5NUD7_9ACTN
MTSTTGESGRSRGRCPPRTVTPSEHGPSHDVDQGGDQAAAGVMAAGRGWIR